MLEAYNTQVAERAALVYRLHRIAAYGSACGESAFRLVAARPGVHPRQQSGDLVRTGLHAMVRGRYGQIRHTAKNLLTESVIFKSAALKRSGAAIDAGGHAKAIHPLLSLKMLSA